MAGKRFEVELPVELPEEVLAGFGWQDGEVPERIREALVMELLRRGIISQGKSAELLEIGRWDLYDVMGSYMVPAIDLTPEEVKRELGHEIKPGKSLL